MAEERDPNPNRIRVFLRVRPNNREEGSWFRSGQYHPILRDEHMTHNPDRSIIIDRSGKRYDFDRVFRQEATQRQLFQYGALPTLENVFNGYCGAVLAYGQTGTGKTHTMQGYERDPQGEQRGIIPRSAEYIFHRISRCPDVKFTVTVSFVQIYLDKLQDLFKPEAPEVMINPETERVELPGITQVEVRSPEDLMRHFYWGERHRVTRATKMNETSSRGHAALIVNLEMSPRDNDGSQATRFGKLVLVDLAGYERFTQTGVTTGIAAEEAKKINASLLALGSVVNALAEACAKKGPPLAHHIPYRNAKLTRLLKDCLGGTSVTAIICTIGPCDKYSQETSGTLYFGWRAMAVKVDAKVKETFDPAKYTQILRAKLQAAHERIHSLVSWWSRSNPKDYAKYVQKYGEPEFMTGLAEDDDYEAQIMEALSRAQASGPAPAFSSAATTPALARKTLEEEEEEEEERDIPAAVRQVQRDWRRELDHLSDQARAEEELLRLRHLQDMEEARAAGVSEEMLQNLRREHGEEMSLMREQNRLLKHEIVRQKQKEEVRALLLSAKEANDVSTGRPTAADALAQQRQQEFHRIAEIVEHLQQTCETKDEVLNRMFELICYYEATINDYDVNVVAIAAAHGGSADADKQLAEARKREEELRTLAFLQNEELEALRKTATRPAVDSPRADSLDAQWSRAMATLPTAASTELEMQAIALREQLRDVLGRMEAPPQPSVVPRPSSRSDLLPLSSIAPSINSPSLLPKPATPITTSAFAPQTLGPSLASTSIASTVSSLQRIPGSTLTYDLPGLGSPLGTAHAGPMYSTSVARLGPSSPLQSTPYYRSEFGTAPLDAPGQALSASSTTYRFGSSGSLGRTSSGTALYSGSILQPATISPVTSYVPGYGVSGEELTRLGSSSHRVVL